MTSTRFIEHLPFGDHASRPAASAVPEGTLYACSDHPLIYQSNGIDTWSTWATLGGGGLSTFGAARDSYIYKQQLTTNYGAGTGMTVGNKYDGSSAYTSASFIAFDVSALAGETIYRATLELYVTAKSNSTDETSGQNSLLVRRNLRDWVEDEITYNVYSSGNNWAAAGSLTDGSDVENDIVCFGRQYFLPGAGGSGTVLAGAVATYFPIEVTPILARALGLSLTELNLQLNEYLTPASQNSMTFATKEHATAEYRPRLVVWHS